MIRGRKALSALLALVLAVGLMPLPAFADEESTSPAPGEMVDVDIAAIEFVYLESAELAANAEQNIVVGFADDSFVAAQAQLAIARDGEEPMVISQVESVEGAVLFTVAPGSLIAGSYEVCELLFADGSGEVSRIDFTVDGEAEYRFDVIDVDAAEIAAEPVVEAYTVDESGELVEADDIGEAMAAAGIDPMSGPEASGSAGSGAMSTQANDGFVVVIDPGHGGSDGGATGIGFYEKDVNLKISQYCKAALEKVPGVTVYMTRTDDTYVSLSGRVQFAIDHHADLLLCLHNNAGGGSGSEVIVPRNGSWYYEETYVTGQGLGKRVLEELNALGLSTHGGVYSTDSDSGDSYKDGTLSDGFFIIRESRREAGILGIIVEHAFVDNAGDAQWLNNDANLKKLGEADAQAVLEYYDSSEGIDRLYWGIFDYDYYTGKYPDVKAEYGPGKLKVFGHFKSTGMAEGQRANVLFDVQFYKAKYEDLQKAFGGDLPKYYQHFLEYGMSEGRQASADFVPEYYKANYSDLRAAFGSDWTKYYKHYLEYGISEKRTANELLPGAILDSDVAAMYRLYNPNSGEHFYTASEGECDYLIDVGWRYEGIGWTAPKTSATPVYRVYNANGGEHHYTTNSAEKNNLVSLGWTDEGIGWYSDDSKAKPLYRQYNPNAFSCNHNYTTNESEKNNLISLGWKDEGIGWYGLDYESSSTKVAVSAEDEAIMGSSKASVAQMVSRYNAMGKPYPSGVYAKYGASTIDQFCRILYEEANAEGVRAEVVFAQAMHETGWLQFGGDVKAEQCNFAGIGATGGGEPGNSFNTYGVDSVRMGLRAQVQHLKAYASTDALKNPTVDPRFSLVTRGSAKTVQALGGKWAVGSGYGDALVAQIRALLSV